MSARFHFVCARAAAALALCWSVQSHAATVPFTEHFNASHANWYNPAGNAPADWVASGGVDDSGYITTGFNFANQTPGLPFPSNTVTLFRAQDEFNSSDHAFEGNWNADGVTEFSFWVRHNAPTAMLFFTRFATPANFPAWSGVEFTPVAPNLWSRVSLQIYFGNPNLFYSGANGGLNEYNAVFGNVGHVQIGVYGGAMAGVNQVVTFDLDQPSIIPAPGALALVALAGLYSRRRR